MRANANLCPTDIVESLEAYARDGRPPRGFLRACLENNLRDAVARADADNLAALPHIVAWMWANLPFDLWQSPEAVRRHLDRSTVHF